MAEHFSPDDDRAKYEKMRDLLLIYQIMSPESWAGNPIPVAGEDLQALIRIASRHYATRRALEAAREHVSELVERIKDERGPYFINRVEPSVLCLGMIDVALSYLPCNGQQTPHPIECCHGCAGIADACPDGFRSVVSISFQWYRATTWEDKAAHLERLRSAIRIMDRPEDTDTARADPPPICCTEKAGSVEPADESPAPPATGEE